MSNLNYGYWEVSTEKSGRIKMPTALLKRLPEEERKNFWMTHGFGKHIMLWTESAYCKQMDYLNSLDRNNREIKVYRNAFLRNTANVECDAQDRFVIPRSLMDFYEIDKEVVLLLDNGQVEIWNYDQYQKDFGVDPAVLDKLNEEIHSGKFKTDNQLPHE